MPMIHWTIITYVMLTVRQIATLLLISTAPYAITTIIAHPMPSILDATGKIRRIIPKVNTPSTSQAHSKSSQSGNTGEGNGICRKNAKRLMLWASHCAESQGEGFRPKGGACYSAAEMPNVPPAFGECFAPKQPYLYVGSCPAWNWHLAKLPARECAEYGGKGWSPGKEDNKKQWKECLGIDAMRRHDEGVVGICFQPADKAYKKTLGNCSAFKRRIMTTGRLCHDQGGLGFEDFSETQRCWPPDKMLDTGLVEILGHCYGARRS